MSLQEPTSGKKPPPKQSKPIGGVDLKKKIAKKTKPKDTESNGRLKLAVRSMHRVYLFTWPQGPRQPVRLEVPHRTRLP